MRTVRLKLSDNISLSYKVNSDGKRVGLMERLHRLTHQLGFWVALVSVVVLPFAVQAAWDFRAELPVQVLIIIFTLLALVVGAVILGGWKNLIDPPTFIQVLVFALLIVGAFLFSPVPDQVPQQYVGANTFGISGYEYLAGIFVMGFVVLFYVLNLFLRNRKKVNWFGSALVLSIVLFTLLLAFDQKVLATVAPISMLALPVLFAYVVFGNRGLIWWAALLGLIIDLLFVFQNPLNLWLLLIEMIGLVGILLFWLTAHNWAFPNPVQTLIASLRKLLGMEMGMREFIKENGLGILLLTIVVWFLITVVWILNDTEQVRNLINGLVYDYRSAVAKLDGWQEWLVGNGITLSPRGSTLSIVLIYQGLIGVAAYALMWVTGIYLGLRTILMEFKASKQISKTLVWIPLLVMVPFIGLITSLSFLEILLWWLVVGMLSARTMLAGRNKVTKGFNKLVIRNYDFTQFLPFIQIALLVLVVAGMLWLAPFLSEQILS